MMVTDDSAKPAGPTYSDELATLAHKVRLSITITPRHGWLISDSDASKLLEALAFAIRGWVSASEVPVEGYVIEQTEMKLSGRLGFTR